MSEETIAVRYELKHKAVSLCEMAVIRDADGHDVYKIRRPVFSPVHKVYSMLDLEDREVLLLKRRVWTWGHVFDLFASGEMCATVRMKNLSFPTNRFTVEVKGGEDLAIEGSPTDMHYRIKRGEVCVARVSRKFWSAAYSYSIDVNEVENTELILGCVLVVDLTTTSL